MFVVPIQIKRAKVVNAYQMFDEMAQRVNVKREVLLPQFIYNDNLYYYYSLYYYDKSLIYLHNILLCCPNMHYLVGALQDNVRGQGHWRLRPWIGR